MRPSPTVLVGFALVLTTGPAHADRLLVYGPAGTGAERRALAVLQRPDGTCASWAGLSVEAEEPDVAVRLEEAEGDCARWIAIQASPPRPQVTVRVRGPDAETAAAVAMGSDRGLELHTTRTGRRLRVRVMGAAREDDVRVTAAWSDGSRSLDRVPGAHDTFAGDVPTDGLVALVARSGSLVGADASTGEGPHVGSEPLVVPSALAVPAGAAVRTASFVVVTDARGRLSRSVPLRVVSRRGRLRSLTWVKPGVAAVGLSADPGTPSVDLSAWTLSESSARTIEIPVVADWPGRGHLEVAPTAPHGTPLAVSASATTLEGEAVPAERVQVWCDDVRASSDEAGALTCAPPEGDGGREVTVVAGVLVDGQVIPFAHARVSFEAAPPPPRPAPPRTLVRTAAPVPAARRANPFAPAAIALVGLDSSGATAWGAGVRTDLALGRSAFVTAAARYTGASIDATPVGALHEPLVGTRHAAELQAGAGVRLRAFGVPLAAAATVGPSWLFTDAALGTTDVESHAFRVVAQASAGPRGRVGGLALGIDVGVRVVPWSTEETWQEPLVTAFVEVMGGTAIE